MSKNTAVQCVGIILDGNRRWAKERGLPSLFGHKEGAERLREAVDWTRSRGIPHLVVYAFSSENWKRTDEEVSYLMDLFVEYAGKFLNKSDPAERGIAIRYIGDVSRAPQKVKDALKKAEASNDQHPDFTLWVCFSYGGRPEIVAAAEALRKEGKEITEETLPSRMWSAGMPDPDIIIRTGGERRISNFLLWQVSYSEFFFVEPYWPDFTEELYDGIIKEFLTRERRRGK
jgi:undecaprenyl diphosphate synthase